MADEGRIKKDDDLEKEIRAHLEMEAEENLERGMSAEEARYAARRIFGNATRVKEQVRELRAGTWLETVAQDVRYALRMLRHSPGFTTVAILSLASGIAVNSAIFGIVSNAVYPIYPYRDPFGILRIQGVRPASARLADVSARDYAGIKEQNNAFGEVAAAGPPSSFNVSTAGEFPERLLGLGVTTNLFSFLGVQPALGRDFAADEDRVGHEHVAIIGNAYWERRFANSPRALGQVLRMNGEAYTIIGVLPPSFRWLSWRNSACGDPTGEERHCLDVFVPLLRSGAEESGTRELFTMARLKPGVTTEQARADMNLVARRLGEQYPESDHGWGLRVTGLRDSVTSLQPGFVIMQVAVGLVLLIACANVANLLLARALSRGREIALRHAIGASRWRVLRQFMTEGFVLAALGGAAGLGLTPGVLHGLAAITGLDLLAGMVDIRVVWFTAISSVASAFLFALAPALHSARTRLGESLQAGARGSNRGATRLRNFLVAGEIALATVLLTSAVLLTKSVSRYFAIDPGFDARNIVFARVPLSDRKYHDEALRAQTVRALLDRVRHEAGIEEAALVSWPPMVGADEAAIRKLGDERPVVKLPRIRYRAASAGYLKMAGVQVVKGRDFRGGDADGSVAIINSVMAGQLWPNEDPIGKRFTLESSPTSREVVGIMPELPDRDVRERRHAQFIELNSAPAGSPWLMVRTATDPRNFAASLRRAVSDVDREQPIAALQTMKQTIAVHFNETQASLALIGLFAGLALALAAVGVYGSVAYSFAQRRQEVGVRIALGAGRQDIYRLVLGQGVRIAAAGVSAGMLLSVGVTRFLKAALYGVTPTDPVAFGAAAAVLFLMTILAAWTPARSAAVVDPLHALRYE